MKEKYKKPWIVALRSGKFKQGHTNLKNNDGRFCCLGVLAEINGYDPTLERYKLNGTEYLNDKLLNKFDLSEEAQRHLAAMNDGGEDAEGNRLREHTFDEIADYIEKNL